MLRCQSTYHSNSNGILAGSECDKPQDHNIWKKRWSSTTIQQHQGAAFHFVQSQHLTVAIVPRCSVASFKSHHAQAHELWIILGTHLPWHNVMLFSSGWGLEAQTNPSHLGDTFKQQRNKVADCSVSSADFPELLLSRDDPSLLICMHQALGNQLHPLFTLLLYWLPLFLEDIQTTISWRRDGANRVTQRWQRH